MAETGEYIIEYYSEKGKKLKDHTEIAKSFIDAKEAGSDIEFVIDEVDSFTIDLRMFNSKDKH